MTDFSAANAPRRQGYPALHWSTRSLHGQASSARSRTRRGRLF